MNFVKVVTAANAGISTRLHFYIQWQVCYEQFQGVLFSIVGLNWCQCKVKLEAAYVGSSKTTTMPSYRCMLYLPSSWGDDYNMS